MDDWHATYLGLQRLPPELTEFEAEAFFSFSHEERKVIERRRLQALRLGLALQIGFLRMSGGRLDAVDVVPAVLWKRLGRQLGGPRGHREMRAGSRCILRSSGA